MYGNPIRSVAFSSSVRESKKAEMERILKNDKPLYPYTRKVGKFILFGSNHLNGCLFMVEGKKMYLTTRFENAEEDIIVELLTAFRNIPRLYKHIVCTSDEDFYWYSIALDAEIKNPITREIGEYTIVGMNYKNGSLFSTDGFGYKHYFATIKIEQITESDIDSSVKDYNMSYPVFQINKELEKKGIDRFEKGKMIVEKKESDRLATEKKIQEEKDKQTSEHVDLIKRAFEKNPAIISIVFNEYPEILQKALEVMVSKMLPTVVSLEMQQLKKELIQSVYEKLPEIIAKMIE